MKKQETENVTKPTRESEQALEEAGLNLWFPMTGADAALIGKLTEELGEATAAASRCLIQRIGESEPVTGKLNKEWLEDELADVWAMANLTISRFNLNPLRMMERCRDKERRKKVWLDALDKLNDEPK